ncbi:MAG: hypothetical protein F4Z66_00010 [Gammaproteobacteria bacterium]|nr:hypothetical protein [Gammaproteobacteria bacterium]
MPLDDHCQPWIASWDASDQHRTGTAGDRQTSEWLLRVVSSLGAKAELYEFPFIRKDVRTAYLQIAHMNYEGFPMFDGGTTLGGDSSGVLSTTPDKDSILVLDESNSDTSLESARRSQELKGVVVVSNLPIPGLALLNADRYGQPYGPPVLQVPSESKQELLGAADSNRHASLSIVLDDQDTDASNVEVTIRGIRSDLAPVVFMTPKSSWYTSTAERIGGIVCWLECLRHFVQHPPTRDVIFTANTGHELGHVGLSRFLDTNPQLTKCAHLWVHFGANFGATDSNVRLQSSSENHLSTMRSRLQKHNVSVSSETKPGFRPGGEARNIFDGGGEYVSILGSNKLFHHPDDRFSTNVDLPRLLRIRSAMLECVQHWATSV